jgi:hypothetical protein
MKIFTFHDNIGRDMANLPLVYLWKERWAKLGWEPIILSDSDARRHPLYELYSQRYHNLPTVNGKAYETACYQRWLAMAVVGGGWMSDYDVVTYSFKPQDHPWRLTLWNGGACPCLVSGLAREYERLAERFANWRPSEKDVYDGRPHCSDQNILDQIPDEYDRQSVVVQYKDPGWETAAAVHYAGCVMSDKSPKFHFIPKLRP